MKNLKVRYVLGIDPSGSFKEGKGRTGWCIFDRVTERVIRCGEVRASEYSRQEAYWLAHQYLIEEVHNKYKDRGVAISMEDYVLYSASAKAQINSAMETCQLIGFIKMVCYLRNIPLYMRFAVHVKKRWTDTILCNKSVIYKAGDSYFTDASPRPLSEHIRDSIRHAMHCAAFELKEDNDERSKR